MCCVAEITDQFRWLAAPSGAGPARLPRSWHGHEWFANLPANLESAEGLWIISAVYLALLLAGLVVDIVMGVRLLAVRAHPGHAASASLPARDAPLTQPADWTRGVEHIKGRAWTWREAGLIASILLIAQLAVNGIHWICVELKGTTMDAGIPAVLCQGVGFHLIGLAALAWVIHRRRMSWSIAFGMQWRVAVRRVGQGMLWYLGILPVVLVASLAYQMILFRFGYPFSVQNVVLFFIEPQSLGVRILLLVLAIGIAPLTEEALFRGVALPLLARTIGVMPAILLTAACFALIHFHVPSFAPLFVLALGFAVAYIVTQSLWVPVVMHALFNGMNIGLLLLATPR